MRELLSLLIHEEKLLLEGKKEEKKIISKKRYALHKKFRFLNDQYSLPLYEEEKSDLKEVFESLKDAIFLQKKRNLLLQKKGCSENPLAEKIQIKKKKTLLLTLMDDTGTE
jgi:hypothetical protein